MAWVEVGSHLTTRDSPLITTRIAGIALVSQCGHVASCIMTVRSYDGNCSPNCERESITTCREKEKNYIVKNTFILQPPLSKVTTQFPSFYNYPFYHQTHESQVHFFLAKGFPVTNKCNELPFL